MKVFISQPMSSRTDEEIFEMRDEIKRIVMSPILKNRFGYDESEVEFLSTYDDEFNTNLTEEELCDLMCGKPEEDEEEEDEIHHIIRI